MLISQWINPFDYLSISEVVSNEIDNISKITALSLLGGADDVSMATDVQSIMSLIKSLKLSRSEILNVRHVTIM